MQHLPITRDALAQAGNGTHRYELIATAFEEAIAAGRCWPSRNWIRTRRRTRTSRACWKEVSVAHTESTEATAGTESAESPMHEGSTISLRALIRFVVVFVAALIVVHLLIWGVFVVFRAAVGQERQITGVEAAHLPPDALLAIRNETFRINSSALPQ